MTHEVFGSGMRLRRLSMVSQYWMGERLTSGRRAWVYDHMMIHLVVRACLIDLR